MTEFSDSPYEGQLEVIATLAKRGIDAAIQERNIAGEMDITLKSMLRDGVDISDLSAASGLTPAQIRKRVDDVPLDADFDVLAGTR